MTQSQTLHLIEQFAAQAPFALWITDARGVAIFANKKLHEMLEIKNRPSGAIGMNLFDGAASDFLGLSSHQMAARQGDVLDTVVDVPNLKTAVGPIESELERPISLRVVVYPLFSTSQKIEHFVILLDDVTKTYRQRAKLEKRIHDIDVFKKSKSGRLDKQEELEKKISLLESEIRGLGAAPVA
jgi:hypothetical protein